MLRGGGSGKGGGSAEGKGRSEGRVNIRFGEIRCGSMSYDGLQCVTMSYDEIRHINSYEPIETHNQTRNNPQPDPH